MRTRPSIVALVAAWGLSACQAPEPVPVDTGGEGTTDVDTDTDADTELGIEVEVDEDDADVRPPEIPYEEQLFTCYPEEPASSPARIRRLNRHEWTRSVGQSIGSLADTNPFDAPEALAYPTYSEGVTIDPATLDLYLHVAYMGGGSWASRDRRDAGLRRQRLTYEDKSLQCMWSAGTPDDACIDNWLGTFLERGVFYREPTDAEWTAVRALLVKNLETEAEDERTRTQTLQKVGTAAWLMPGALFREELGGGLPDEAGRHRLADDELARMVAYMLSDRGPGTTASYSWRNGPDGSSWTAPMAGYLADIREAGKDGSIQDESVLRSLIRNNAAGVDPGRYDLTMGGPGSGDRGRRGEFWTAHKIEAFFLDWFDVRGFPNAFKEAPEATSQFEREPWSTYDVRTSYNNLQSGYYGREPDMIAQFSDTVSRIVVEDEQVLRKLLTTRTFYVAADGPYRSSNIHKATNEVTRPYGVTWSVEGDRESRWVELPEDERSGLLTHPAWLAAHGDSFQDGPSLVLRGHWIRENLLCQEVPGLEEVMVEALLQPTDGSVTARHRIEADIESRAECMACHRQMNSLGKPFELYNHAGFLRERDGDGPPDGSTVIDDTSYGAPDIVDGSYDSPMALTQALAESPTVKRCFVRQTFRYFMGRDETVHDACALTRMEQAYDDSGGSFISMLEALATSDAALYRHVPEER